MLLEVFSFMKFLKNYFIGAYRELHKVTWLTRQQVIGHTAIVLGVTFCVAVCIALLDFGFQYVYSYILNNF